MSILRWTTHRSYGLWLRAAVDDKAAIARSESLAEKLTSALFGVGLPTEEAYVAVAAA